jgi:cyanate permease
MKPEEADASNNRRSGGSRRCAGFAFSLGRILGAVGPTLVGAFVVITGSYPWAIATMSVIYLLGLPAIALAPETAGKALPV